MKQMSTEDIKRVANEILLKIKEVCDTHDIKYYLAYGTVLGAVRHKGFIPWDDDIDIYMTRDEFAKFRIVMNKDNSPYKLLCLEDCESYSHPLPKVIDSRTVLHELNKRETMTLGVYVDLFILDVIPNDNMERENFFKGIERRKLIWDFLNSKTWVPEAKLYKNLIRLAFCWTALMNPRKAALRLYNYCSRYKDSIDVEIMGNLCHNVYGYNREVVKSEWLENKSIELFEEVEYPCPKSDDYLKQIYGNYMELPPVEKRVSRHQADAYFK